MSRFRLRYENTDLEMPLGDFVIGRGSSSNLALDDGLVSRRHAVLRTRVDHVTVEDLGSRNGVLVNGVRITGERALAHRDVITIGGQALVLLDRRAREMQEPSTTEELRCERCGAFNDFSSRACGACGNALPRPPAMDTFDGHHTMELNLHELAAAAAPVASAPEPAREDTAFRLVASIADKSLSLSRYEEAERMLDRHLEAIRERARRGGEIAPEVFDGAVAYALRLAEGRNAARWISYVIELHTRTRQLMAEAVIERMHERVRRSRYSDRHPIDTYIDLLETMTGQLSARDRFLVKRLEALQRVIAA